MTNIVLPFPREPDATYARSITDVVVPFFEGARQEAFLEEAQSQGRYPNEARRPEYSRFPKTQRFRDEAREGLMQLGIAFYALHGNRGFSCSAEDRERDPRKYGLEKHLHWETDFSRWMVDEVSRRQSGPEPFPPTEVEVRMSALVRALKEAFGGQLVVATANLPPEESPVSPHEQVLKEAVDYYEYLMRDALEL